MAIVLALSSACRRLQEVCACRAPLSWQKAAEAEQLDWPAFLRQAKDWVLSVLAQGETSRPGSAQLRLIIHLQLTLDEHVQ